MKNFKVVLIFALGTVLVFVFFMFFYGGGHSGLKTNQLQSDFHTIFLAMNMNFASKGYYPNTIEELKEYGEFESNFFSIFITPDEYMLCDDVKIEHIPEEYRSMAFSDYSKFLVVAVQCVDEDDSPAVFTLDEKNNMTQVSGN
jgi:hypothetical protein